MAVTRASLESRDVEQVPPEKDQAVHEEFRQGGLSQEDLDFLTNFSEERRKIVLHKVDVRIALCMASVIDQIGS